MSQEVELKFHIAPADVPRLLEHPLLQEAAQGAFRSEPLVSIYYDTPKLDLNRRSITLCVQQGPHWLQTVKASRMAAADLHTRTEETCEVADDMPDFEVVHDPHLRTVFADEHMRLALRPLFSIEVTRASTLLAFANGDRIEVAVDQGAIKAGEKTLAICEVELAHKAGHASRLFDVALGVQDTMPLTIEPLSKAERGYRLVTQTALTPVKAVTPPLQEDLTTSEAFLAILRGCLAHLHANAEGVMHGNDPEFIHQLRVAVRQLHSAFTLFKELVPKEHTAALREEFRWLTGEFNGARNWDVFSDYTLPPILAAFPDEAGLQAFATQSAERRRAQDHRAQEALRAQRYHRLLLQLGGWVETQPWQTDASDERTVAPELPIAVFAARVLQKRHKNLKQRGAQLATLTPPERHQVRIATKKLRYAVDFFAALFPRKSARRYRKAITALQKILGELNDEATATALVQELAPATEEGRQQEARGIVLGWVRGTNHRRVQELEAIWEEFIDQKRFW